MNNTTLRQDLEAIASEMTGDRSATSIAAAALEKLATLEAQLESYAGYTAFVESCIFSGERPDSYELYRQSTERYKAERALRTEHQGESRS